MNGRAKDAARLLRRARADLIALRHMGDPQGFDDNIFGFHAQQAVEKALKAWLAGLGEPHPFRHDLAELLAALEAAGQSVADFWPLVDLTPFAVQLRYDDADAGEAPDRKALIEQVTRLVKSVEERLAFLN